MKTEKMKKYLIMSLILVLFFSMLSPFLSSNVEGAEDEEKKENEAVNVAEGLLEKGDVTKIKDMLKYDEGLQLHITKSMIKSKTAFTVDNYSNIFNGGEAVCVDAKKGPCYTNKNIYDKFVKESDLNEAQLNSRGIFRMPIWTADGKKGMEEAKSGKTDGHGILKTNQLFYTEKKPSYRDAGGVLTATYDKRTLYVGNAYGMIDMNKLRFYSPYRTAGLNIKGIAELNPDFDETQQGDGEINGNPHVMMRYAFKSFSKSFPDAKSMFLDSYGNIVSNDSRVIVPYWLNNSVDIFNDKFGNGLNKSYMTTHLNLAVNESGDRFLSGDMIKYYKGYYSYFHEVRASVTDSKNLPSSGAKKLFTGLFEVHEYEKNNTVKVDADFKTNLRKIYDNEEYQDALARYIVSKTKDTVKQFNKEMFEIIADTQAAGSTTEVFVDDSNFMVDASSIDDIDDAKKYINDASTIMAKISRILDIGFFELFRLTIASFVSDFYNSNIISFSVSDVFHTTLLSDSALWNQLVNTILLLAVSFTSLYVIYLSLRMFMGTVTPKEIMMKLVILAIAVASPMILYSPLVNLMFNVPSEKVLSTEMNRMMLLDTWLETKGGTYEKYEEETGYKMTNILRDRKEDYTIEFVTNTSVDGKTLAEMKDNIIPEPSRQQMVTVDVSIFHVMEWLMAVGGERNFSENAENDNVEEEDNMNNFDENTTLFEFLEEAHSRNYEGLSQYKEYSINLGVGLNGIEGFETTENILTASELLKTIHLKYNSMETPVNENLTKITDALFYKGKKPDESNEDDASGELVDNSFSTKEIEIILSELTMTSTMRKDITGSANISEYVNTTLGETVNTNLSATDLLMLEDVLEPLKGIRFGKELQLGQEVQDINRKVIDRYVELYLPLKATVSGSSEESYMQSEYLILELETYFSITDYYKMGLFPRSVNVKNISLDSYVRSMFIPISKFKPGEKTLNDVSEYIALNIDLFSLLMFLVAIVGLFLYGLVKFIVLFVLLMPLILISFFINYVIKNDVNNKSWLGSLTILGAFALVNLGLLGLWKGLIYAMNLNDLNKSLGMSSGGYPYTLTNSFAVIVYLLLVFKFILMPLYKTVKADISNLGGETFSQKFGDITAGFSKTLGKMWGGGTPSKGSNDVIGSVDLNENSKTNKGIVASDTGKAGDMGVTNFGNSEDGELTDKDKESLDLINGKMESSGGIRNITNGKNDDSGKGINKIAKRTAKKVGNKVSDKVTGIRDVIGNSAYNAISKTGRAVGGATGELLGNVAGNSVRRAITGTLGDVASGSQAAMGIAQLTNSGVGATLAGGLLGGILGKAASKVKSPFTLMQAQAMASKLNNLKMKGSKYDKLKDMDEADLERLKKAGLDTQLEGIDGIGSNRANELMYLETDDMVVSEMIAKQLDKDLGAEAVDSKIVLNMDSDEMGDDKVRAQLLNDLVQGVYDSKTEILESGLEFSELGNIPVPYQVGDNSFSMGALGEYSDVYEKLEAEYRNNGIDITTSLDENGHKTVDFVNSKDAESFISDFEERATLYSDMTSNKGPLYSSTTNGEQLIQLLNDNNIEYEVEENSVEYGTAVRLSDVHNDGERFAQILESNKEMSSEMIELTNGHLKSSDDVIVKKLMSEYTKSGKLIEGEDVVYRDNDVIAMSARGKQVMSNIQENYDEERANTLAKLDDFTGKIKESLLNFENGNQVEGGLSFGVHDRTSDNMDALNIERSLKGSSVGKEHYVMRNDYNTDEMESFVNQIHSKRYEVNKGNLAPEELLPEESQLLETVARMKSKDVKIERRDETTLSVFSENREDAALVNSYFDGIKRVEEARKVIRESKTGRN